MIEDLVKNLKSQSDELQMHCASAIFKVLYSQLFIHFKPAKVYRNDAEQNCLTEWIWIFFNTVQKNLQNKMILYR